MATIKVKFRPTSENDNHGIVVYQIHHRNQTLLLKPGYTMASAEWQAHLQTRTAGNPECRKPNVENILCKIAFDKERFTRIVNSFQSTSQNYSAEDIANEFKEYTQRFTLAKHMEHIASAMLQAGKIRTYETYISALKSFTKFCNGEQVMIDHLTDNIMERYQAWLLKRGNMLNTVSFYARILRAAYNRAVEQGITPDRHPFRRIYTGVDKTVKRALPLSVIRKIKNLDLNSSAKLDHARDLFLMSFYLRGMSFVDMAFLKKTDLKGGHVTYRRRKTGQLLTIAWTPEMQQILSKYPPNPTPYLLPIIRTGNKSERTLYRNMAYNINRRLKTIAKMTNISIPLTLYVARHSWASAAKAKGIPLSVICQGMGHDSESTTQIYLASLDNAVVDRANALILSSL